MMFLDFMIAMAQLNIAFGILYVTLKRERYREGTYGVFVEQYNACGDHGYGEFAVNYNKKFDNYVLKDRTLSQYYFFVVGWVKELPEDHRMKLNRGKENGDIDAVNSLIFQTGDESNLNGNSARRHPSLLSKENDFLNRHHFFKKDRDKYLVWFLAILPSAAIATFNSQTQFLVSV